MSKRVLNRLSGPFNYIKSNLTNKGSYEETPSRYINKADPNYQPSIYAPPKQEVINAEITADAPRAMLKGLRKMMAAENRSRGARVTDSVQNRITSALTKAKKNLGRRKTVLNPQNPLFYTYNDAQKKLATTIRRRRKDLNPLKDSLARGAWFHGRGTYPYTGQTFGKSRGKGLHLGEPTGISLTSEKDLLKGRFAKGGREHYELRHPTRPGTRKLEDTSNYLMDIAEKEGFKFNTLMKGALTKQDFFKADRARRKSFGAESAARRLNEKLSKINAKVGNLKNKPFARVFPQYSGKPTEKILFGWKGKGTEKDQEVLKSAYSKSANDLYTKMGVKPSTTSTGDDVKTVLSNYKNEFNEIFTKNLKDKGYSGVLYSPRRGSWDEFEMKMFDPGKVMMLDMRRQSDPALKRLYDSPRPLKGSGGRGGQARRNKAWDEAVKDPYDSGLTETGHSLRDIYRDIDMDKLASYIRQKQGVKGKSPKPGGKFNKVAMYGSMAKNFPDLKYGHFKILQDAAGDTPSFNDVVATVAKADLTAIGYSAPEINNLMAHYKHIKAGGKIAKVP